MLAVFQFQVCVWGILFYFIFIFPSPSKSSLEFYKLEQVAPESLDTFGLPSFYLAGPLRLSEASVVLFFLDFYAENVYMFIYRPHNI